MVLVVGTEKVVVRKKVKVKREGRGAHQALLRHVAKEAAVAHLRGLGQVEHRVHRLEGRHAQLVARYADVPVCAAGEGREVR